MKKKQSYSTYVLLGVLALVVGWYTLYENKVKIEKASQAEKDQLVFTFGRDQIQEMDFTPKGLPVVKLRKTGENWVLTAPIEDAADQGTVGAMLTAVTTTKEERVVDEDPKDLKAFGLDAPTLSLTIRKDASTAEDILIGANTQVGFSVYAKKPKEKKVIKVNRTLQTSFDKTLFEIRNKNLVSFPKIDVSEAEIQGPKGNLVVRTEDKNHWTLARENMPADSNEWNKALAAITDLRATEVVTEKSDKLDKYGLARPYLQIGLTTAKDKPRFTLLIGKVGDQVFAKRDDKAVVYEVDKAFIDKVNKSSAELQDKHLATFNRFDVQRMRMEWHGNAVIELKKVEGGKWELADAKPDEKVDAAQVDRLLTRFQDLKVTRFVDPKSAKSLLEPTQITVQFFEKKDGTEKELTQLKFGRLAKGEVLGTRSGLPLAFALKEDDFSTINVTRKSLLEKAAAPTEPGKETGKPPEEKS